MPTVKINDINLYYEQFGQGQPLVFIHGLGSSGRDWEYQVPTLSEHFQVIVYDLRGHGRSDKPAGPYGLPLFAADAAALLRALDIEAAYIVGLSLGGGIALQLAVDTPGMVRKLVVVNSGPELVPHSFGERLAIWQRFAIVRLMGLPRMGEALSKRLFPSPEQANLRALFVERFAQNDRRAYLDSLRAMVGWSVTSRLGTIQCPTLILASAQDYTPVALKQAYAAKIPHSQLVVIPEAHHAVPVERPELFNEALLTFLLASDKTKGDELG